MAGICDWLCYYKALQTGRASKKDTLIAEFLEENGIEYKNVEEYLCEL